MYIQIHTNIYKGENVMTEKDSMLTVRIEGSLLMDFKNMCEDRGVVMAKVIRGLMIDELQKYDTWQNSGKKELKRGR